MPSYVSKDGICKPAKEKVALYDEKGEPYIYEGPDRAATQVLKDQGVDHLGMPFYEDNQVIQAAHDKKMTVEQFTRQNEHTKEKREKDYKERASKLVTHRPLPRKPAKRQQGGGRNTAGTSGHVDGGFGDFNDAKRKVGAA